MRPFCIHFAKTEQLQQRGVPLFHSKLVVCSDGGAGGGGYVHKVSAGAIETRGPFLFSFFFLFFYYQSTVYFSFRLVFRERNNLISSTAELYCILTFEHVYYSKPDQPRLASNLDKRNSGVLRHC